MAIDIKEKIATISITPDTSIRQAIEAINLGALGIALLVEEETKRFLGLVTDGDIRRALINGYNLETSVTIIPRPQPKSAHVGMNADQIAHLFSDTIRTLPLLNDDGQVVDLAIFDRRIRLPLAEPLLGEKELYYVTECVLSGWVSSAGIFVSRFEEIFAEFCGCRYAIATSNGTAALHLALLALDIGPGDEVILPTLTFIATANAVTYTGARPVFVDSEKASWNIDPFLIKDAITPRTKVIIPVHLYGHPADMDPILDIADRHKLAVVEDAAEAHGAQYKGRRVGGIGDIGIFSFYGNKIITTGEGGMVVTDRYDLANKVRILRDHGMLPERRYWHPVLGYNYRLTNIQAALGVAQMEKIESIITAKRQLARSYKNILADMPGITGSPENSWADSVYWMYSVIVDEAQFGMNRDSLMNYLKGNQIETRPFFPPVHTQPIYETGLKFPVAESLSRSGINLPSAATIRPEEVQRVCTSIRAAHLEIKKI